MWEECIRLITNCIIYEYATILSHLFTQKTGDCDAAGAALLNRSHPSRCSMSSLGPPQSTKAPRS